MSKQVSRLTAFTGCCVLIVCSIVFVSGPTVPAGCSDLDSDGLCDSVDNCPDVANPAQINTDFDALGDACDPCPNDPANTCLGCADQDGDGICAALDNCPITPNPGQLDTDFDGEGDACDFDDDNDGFDDLLDNCPLLPNPGQFDGDFDGAGDLCDPCPTDPENACSTCPDSDSDSICDPDDNCPTDPNPGQEDNEGDLLGDVCDPDDDNDGISDTVDNCPLASNSLQSDSDFDGIGDVCDPCPDDPGPDSDSDGICDVGDNCPAIANADQADIDADGIGDVCDECPNASANDSDGDGICDDVDNCPAMPNSDQMDIDGDGLGDACDICPDSVNDDSDADGVCDDVDNCPSTPNPGQVDSDGDGTGDACDSCPLGDGDADDVCDDVDNCPTIWNPDQTDSDNDGLGDVCDSCPDGDSDGDGVCDDVDNCPSVPNPGQLDTDGDGVGDACDSCSLSAGGDSDGDGVCDDVDNCPSIPNSGQIDSDGDGIGDACDSCPNGDGDADGVCDDVDNCPSIPNSGQIDSDGDGIGDACDSCPNGDGDADGVCDDVDNCPSIPNPGQIDSDGDGIGDACDNCSFSASGDSDGDGVCDDEDNCRTIGNPAQADADLDGLGDVCDPCPAASGNDADGDGVCEDIDNCPSFANPEQIDRDNDGLGDACDPCTDADGDGFAAPGACPAGVEGDCADDNALVNPSVAEVCGDGLDNDCDPATLDRSDADGDGFDCRIDCDDFNPAVFPGRPEICGDGQDNDCDPATPDLTDLDGDGFDCSSDCDDSDPDSNPAAAERCGDGADNDCDGSVDLNDSDCSCPDADGDFYSCNDCDDSDPAVHPGAEELCGDELDNDCDASTPDVADFDSDGFTCVVDCNDRDASVNPGATESCDGVDNDCNGRIDDGMTDIPEQCNLLDDNCNGLVDEGNPDAGNSCSTGELGLCGTTGITICDAGAVTCFRTQGGGPELCGNSVDDDCDGVVDEVDDSDGDRIDNCSDNCPAGYNPSQIDLDGDGAGDFCDSAPATPGGGLASVQAGQVSIVGGRLDRPDSLRMGGTGGPPMVENVRADPQPSQFSWDSATGANYYNVYRGYRTVGNPAEYNHQCLHTSVTSTSMVEPVAPRGDTQFFYFVTSKIGQAGPEGSYGLDGAGNERPVAAIPCPDPSRDRDADGIEDAVDNCPPDLVGNPPAPTSNPFQEDFDADSHGDLCDNCPTDPNTLQSDLDGDGLGDICDPDVDGDGILDDGDGSGTPGDNPCAAGNTTNCDDNCPTDSNPTQFDSDGDGWGDDCDNCPTPNPGQDDADHDGVGDLCDNCPAHLNPTQADIDGDGHGDACDQPAILVEAGTAANYLPNGSDPGIGSSWTAAGFDDSTWSQGPYGHGYDTDGDAVALIATTVPTGTSSVYTRTNFTANLQEVNQVVFGADYDDGVIAWINGVEVYRSAQMPAGAPSWNSLPAGHESSNGPIADYTPLSDITTSALAALQNGTNVLAVGVWNAGASSSDLVLVPQLLVNPTQEVTRGPYLQLGDSTSLTVRWRTDIAMNGEVRYGPQLGNLTSSVQSTSSTTEHEIELVGLTADTTYYYSVGAIGQPLAGGDAQHFFVTAPVTGTAKPTRVWILGDTGQGNAAQRSVRDAYKTFTGSTHTDLWLMLGDNAYQSGTDAEYQSKLFDVYDEMLRKSVLWPSLGNHDVATSDSTTQTGPYFDSFTLPAAAEAGGVASGTEAYYSFDYGNVHFVVLDSADSLRTPGSTMLSWLAADLASTSQDWIVAFWHHPAYSKGSHDSDTETALVEMRENVIPILDSYGVDLTFTGHSHSYERSFLIDGVYATPTPNFATLVTNGNVLDAGDGRVSGDGAYAKPTTGPSPNSGIVHTVAGTGSSVSVAALDHPVMYASFSVLGSVVLDIDGNQVDVQFVDSNGNVLDSFTMSKGP